MKILKTNTTVYEVIQNEDGTLTILWQNHPLHRAGQLINSIGGVDAVLARCKDYTEEEWKAEKEAEKAARKAKAEAKAKREEALTAKYKVDFDAIFGSGEIVEANYKNVCALLRYFQCVRRCFWPRLPKMTIGYSCTQYDCGTSTATAIKLDRAITDEDTGEKTNMFCIGGGPRDLVKYTQIRF